MFLDYEVNYGLDMFFLHLIYHLVFTCINYHIPRLISVCLCVVETIQVLVNNSLGGVVQDGVCAAGPVTLPRRAETFGGFDSHQMNISKSKGGRVFHVCVCVNVGVCVGVCSRWDWLCLISCRWRQRGDGRLRRAPQDWVRQRSKEGTNRSWRAAFRNCVCQKHHDGNFYIYIYM